MHTEVVPANATTLGAGGGRFIKTPHHSGQKPDFRDGEGEEWKDPRFALGEHAPMLVLPIGQKNVITHGGERMTRWSCSCRCVRGIFLFLLSLE